MRLRPSPLLLLGLVVEGGLALTSVALGAWLKTAPLERATISAVSFAWGALATLPCLGLFLWTLQSSWRPLQRIREALEQNLRPLLVEAHWLELFLVSLLAGLGEEMFFRGLLQGWLETKVGFWPAVGVLSLVFGLFHPVTWGYVAGALLIGVYLSFLWKLSGDLTASIVCHALYDFVALLWFKRLRSTNPHQSTEARSCHGIDCGPL